MASRVESLFAYSHNTGWGARITDLAVVTGMDLEEAPVEFLLSEPEPVVQKGYVE